MNLANIHGDWGDFQQKLDLLDLARQKSSDANDSVNLVNTFTNLARLGLKTSKTPILLLPFTKKPSTFSAATGLDSLRSSRHAVFFIRMTKKLPHLARKTHKTARCARR